MVDGVTQPVDDTNRKTIVHEQLAATEIHLALTDEPADTHGAIRLPLDAIPALGVAFASLPSVFRSITTTTNVPTMLQATDKLGNILDPSILQSFNDGSGLLGSFRNASGKFEQARFHATESNTTQSITQLPYNPTMLFMAAAIAQINQKLDSIQASVDEMLEYMRQRDKADMRGNLKTLTDIINNYGLNYGNAMYMSNAHMKVLDIKQKAQQDMEFNRNQAESKLEKKTPLEIRGAIAKRLESVIDYLKEYRLSVYIFSFALFLEPMLSENFEEAKLQSIIERIEEESIRYRQVYTECYNAIEASIARSADAAILNGLSFAGKKLGQAIAATPIGDRTSIDEAIGSAGEGIGKLNDDLTQNLVKRLHEAKSPDTLPFKENIETINVLHNQPSQLAIDRENIYILQSQNIEHKQPGQRN